MIVECNNCKQEMEYDKHCPNCNKKISFFPRIVKMKFRENHLIITINCILGMILGGFFGYYSTGDNASSMLLFVTVIVCINVAILCGFVVGKTVVFCFNAMSSLNAPFQYGSFIFSGGLHGLIFTLALYTASGWDFNFYNLSVGAISGALLTLAIFFYIRDNVDKMEDWW